MWVSAIKGFLADFQMLFQINPTKFVLVNDSDDGTVGDPQSLLPYNEIYSINIEKDNP